MTALTRVTRDEAYLLALVDDDTIGYDPATGVFLMRGLPADADDQDTLDGLRMAGYLVVDVWVPYLTHLGREALA